MKICKLDGIKMLQKLGIPTVQLLDVSKIIAGEISIDEGNGISVRLSPKDRSVKWDVGLPSINRRKNISEVREFIQKYKEKYDIFAHETVRPEILGAISRLGDELIIETYKDYDKKHEQEIDNCVTIPVMGNRFLVNKMQLKKKDEKDFNRFREVIMYLRKIPFEVFDAECVFQDLGYICCSNLGRPRSRSYASPHFKQLLKDNNLPNIK